MTWLSAALATVGFCLYFVALTLQSTSLRRMRFARVANLALLRRRVPRRFRGRVCALLLVLSLILMGFAVWHSINVGRSVFILLASFGVILIAIRLLGFLFTHISLIALEIDTDPGSSKFSFAHLRRSPFILGGLTLVVLGVGIPTVLDSILWARFDSYRREQWEALEADAKRNRFQENYRPRTLMVAERSWSETEFFSSKEMEPGSGRRILIEGRGGVGKSWFIDKLRFDYRDRYPNNVAVFLDAKDPTVHDEVLEHISRDAFGGLAWGGLPVARQILAQALILIDGLDEAKDQDDANNAVQRFAQDQYLARDTVIVTRRPIDYPLSSFMQVRLNPLVKRESLSELNNRAAKLKDLPAKLDQQPPAEILFFHADPLKNWPHITPDQVGQLYQEFVKKFFFAEFSDRSIGQIMAFLSTYRDIDIVDELFRGSMTGEFKPAPQSVDEMRQTLIKHFVRLRVVKNFRSHFGPSDAKFAQRVIDMLTIDCSDYLREAPETTTFAFDPRQFRRNFDGTTFDRVLLESELLSKDITMGRLVFANPELDKYFIEQAKELLSAPESGPPH